MLIKLLLAEHEKYKDVIDVIKKDIAHIPFELKKTSGKRYYLMNESQITFIMIFNFKN